MNANKCPTCERDVDKTVDLVNGIQQTPIVNACLCHKDLSGIDFNGKALTNCSFHYADFGHADLNGATFTGCTFKGADLCGCQLPYMDSNSQNCFRDATIYGVRGSVGADVITRMPLSGSMIDMVELVIKDDATMIRCDAIHEAIARRVGLITIKRKMF